MRPTRLPILFALDKKLRIPGGFYYSTDCEQLRKAGVASGHCGGDFADFLDRRLDQRPRRQRRRVHGGRRRGGDFGGDGGGAAAATERVARPFFTRGVAVTESAAHE